MKKSKFNLLALLVAIYGVFYLLEIVIPLIRSATKTLKSQVDWTELTTVSLAFALFVVAAIYAWYDKRKAGILLMVWHFVVWGFAYLLWKDAGMVLLLIFPMLFPAVFLVRQWHLEKRDGYNTGVLQWKLVLRLLFVNYAAIYMLIILSDVVPRIFGWAPSHWTLIGWNYQSVLGLALIFSAILFFVAFVFSWKSELITGILLITWYLIVVVLTQQFPVFEHSGPWAIVGLPILVQGIFYVIYSLKFEARQPVL